MSERWEQQALFESVSFAEGSPAKTSAGPGSALASPRAPEADSGSSSIASSASSRPNGSSSRTSRRGLGGGCPVCGTTCGLEATEPVPSRFLPPTSERRSSGDESSSWATPTASDAKRAALTPGAAQAQNSITQAVCSEIWPTPTANDYGTQRGTGQAPRPSLSTLARLWPTATATATATDASGSRRLGYPGQGSNTTLTDATLGHHGEATGPGGPSGLVLNPAFVEALMGFPAGWTELD